MKFKTKMALESEMAFESRSQLAPSDRILEGDEILSAVFDYWEGKRAARGIVSRSDLDPIDIPRLLPHIGLIDVLGREHFRYRLIGSYMNDMFGQDFTGSELDRAKYGPYMEFLRGLYDRSAGAGVPIFNEAYFGYARLPDLIVRRLILPLRPGPSEPVNMLLFANSFRTASSIAGPNRTSAAWMARPFPQEQILALSIIKEVVIG